MIKIRVTFSNDSKGNKELEQLIELLDKNMTILNESEIYKQRGQHNLYASKYLDVRVDKVEK